MKIAVSSQGNSLQAEVDPRFGRAKYFVIFDTQTKQHQILKNQAVDADSGAGVQSAQLIVDQNVEAVLTGRVGPKALRGLEAGQVKIYDGLSGEVEHVIEKFLAEYQKGS